MLPPLIQKKRKQILLSSKNKSKASKGKGKKKINLNQQQGKRLAQRAEVSSKTKLVNITNFCNTPRSARARQKQGRSTVRALSHCLKLLINQILKNKNNEEGLKASKSLWVSGQKEMALQDLRVFWSVVFLSLCGLLVLGGGWWLITTTNLQGSRRINPTLSESVSNTDKEQEEGH